VELWQVGGGVCLRDRVLERICVASYPHMPVDAVLVQAFMA